MKATFESGYRFESEYRGYSYSGSIDGFPEFVRMIDSMDQAVPVAKKAKHAKHAKPKNWLELWLYENRGLVRTAGVKPGDTSSMSDKRSMLYLCYAEGLKLEQRKEAKKAIHLLGASGYKKVDGYGYVWRVSKDEHDPKRIARAKQQAWYYAATPEEQKAYKAEQKTRHEEWKAAHPERYGKKAADVA